MLLTFNDVIAHGGLGLDGVRLLRHVREGLVRWRRGPEHFDDYTSYQNTGNGGPLNNASVAFGIVPGPKLEDGDDTALFVRAHRVLDRWIWTGHDRVPALAHPHELLPVKKGVEAFDLEHLPQYDQFAGRVLVRWGKSTRGWSQWADRQPKEVVELRLSAAEPPFPGFAHFSATVEDVLVLPEAWIGALSSVGGVYLLVCPRTGEQYVGSATGVGGFMGRWAAYANDGHGGNRLLRSRQPSNYSISILEVASPDMAPRDVVQRDAAWKRKLGSRAHGLNAN